MLDSTLAHTIAVVVGAGGAIWFLSSAVRSLVIPRPERVWLTTSLFRAARAIAVSISHRYDDLDRRHRILGSYAPTVLIVLPLVWSTGLILSFAAINWGIDGGSFATALELSGSSLTTLGFVPAPTFTLRLVAILEALIGLAIVALVISFLPTVYGAFSRREVSVGELTVRAGEPPSPVEFISRLDRINMLSDVNQRWEEWERWFTELAETHTSFPGLIHFRSADRGRSWVTAAETALDTASLVAALGLAPAGSKAPTMIRAGYLSLRAIADHQRIEPELDPGDRHLLSIDKSAYEDLHRRLVDTGVDVRVSVDEGWHHFAGWRINYDRAIVGLQELVHDVPSHWTERHG